MSIDFAAMDNEALTASLTKTNESLKALFALDSPTIAQVDEIDALMAAAKETEAEKKKREDAAKDAADRFAQAKAEFSGEGDDEGDESESEGDDDTEGESQTEGDTEVEASAGGDDEGDESEGDEGDEGDEPEAVTASAVDHTKSQKITASAARRVGKKTKRPAVAAAAPVTITAAADVPGFSTGQRLDGMSGVTAALLNRAKGFAPHNERSAAEVRRRNGGQEDLHKVGLASFGVDFDKSLVASAGNDYSAVRNAIRGGERALTASMAGNQPEALSAAAWCAPSQPVYSYIADYVVDGLLTLPEVSAPRGGLLMTTGPARSSQGSALDDFGFVQTEAQAEAGQVKNCEVIECPEFEDHRLDAIGYCYKIPILTQKAYPELITDALRFAGVLYAHKVNRRLINDIVALSDTRTFNGYGPSFTDALEALSIIAVKERRKWNVGVNAVLEVKLPEWAREVFRADMSRRSAVAFDSVTDQQIAQHFTDRHLAVEYIADWQELGGVNAILPGQFTAVMYPSGTFVKAVEDVISLQAVYDAASLSVNEYTGVFFEQGIMVAKAGYGSSLVNIPVNTAGEMGALTLQGLGDASANGSV